MANLGGPDRLEALTAAQECALACEARLRPPPRARRLAFGDATILSSLQAVAAPSDASDLLERLASLPAAQLASAGVVVVVSALRPWAAEAELLAWGAALREGGERLARALVGRDEHGRKGGPGRGAGASAAARRALSGAGSSRGGPPATPPRGRAARSSQRAGGPAALGSAALSGSDLAAALRAAQAQRWDLLDRAAQAEAQAAPGLATGALPGSPSGPLSPGSGRAADGEAGSGLLPLVVVLTDADVLDDADGASGEAGAHPTAALWKCVAQTTGSRRQAAIARIRRVCIGLRAALVSLPSNWAARPGGTPAGAAEEAAAAWAGSESKQEELGGTFGEAGAPGAGDEDDGAAAGSQDGDEEDEDGDGLGGGAGSGRRRKRLGGVAALSGYAWTLAQEGVLPWSAGVARLWRQASAAGDAASLVLPHGFDAPDMVDDIDPAAVGGDEPGTTDGQDGAGLGAALCDMFAGPRAEAVAAGAELPAVADLWRWQGGAKATAPPSGGAQHSSAGHGAGGGLGFVGRVPDESDLSKELEPLMRAEAASRAAEARAVDVRAEVIGWLAKAAAKVGTQSAAQAGAAEDLALLRREAGAMAAEQLTAAEGADAAAAPSPAASSSSVAAAAAAADSRPPAAAFNSRRAVGGLAGASTAATAGADAAVPPKAPSTASGAGRDDDSPVASGAPPAVTRRPRRGSGASTGSSGKQRGGKAFFQSLRSSKS